MSYHSLIDARAVENSVHMVALRSDTPVVPTGILPLYAPNGRLRLRLLLRVFYYSSTYGYMWVL